MTLSKLGGDRLVPNEELRKAWMESQNLNAPLGKHAKRVE